MSQTSSIIHYMKHHGSINPMQSLRHIKCFRLAARIQDARDSGYKIVTTMTKRGDKRFATYTLHGE